MKILQALRGMFNKSVRNNVISYGTDSVANQPVTPVSPVVLHDGDYLQLESDGYPILQPMRVQKKIDTGGFGTVFVVEMDNKIYALKILTLWLKLPNEWADLVRRFESSFRAGQIFSKYIITYYHKGYYKGNPCILMEYCPNGHLESRMEEFYPKEKWVSLAVDLLQALKDLHANGIIHKDFKPKNILFNEDDVPQLTDFDFSAFLDKRNTITKGGRALDLWYTAIYSPPEQIDPNLAYEKTSPPVDMFAFGVTMYQVITGGKLPWGSFEEYHNNPDAYYEKIKTGDFVKIMVYRPDIPADWAYNIERCLQPKIEDRVQTPVHFLQSVYVYKKEEFNPALSNEDEVPGSSAEVEIMGILPNDIEKTSEPNSYVLEVKAGANNIGQQIYLNRLCEETDEDYFLIGRSKVNPIFIDAILPSEGVHHVSRGHATLKYENNYWQICDGAYLEGNRNNGSTNGTEVFNPMSGSNKIVASTEFMNLEEEDIINLAGEVTLKFYKEKISDSI